MAFQIFRTCRENYFSYALLISFFILAAIAIFYRGSASEPVYTGVNPAFSAYISGYTSGNISRASAIRIQFTTVPGEKEKAEADLTSLFRFQPAIEGEAQWLDSVTLEFVPKSWLPSGKGYLGSFQIQELLPVPDSLAVFAFTFNTIRQGLEISDPWLEATDPQQMVYQRMIATLLMADLEKDQDVEKLVQAQFNGAVLPIKWEHAADGRSHRLLIDSIERKEKKQELKLFWNGKPLGLQAHGSKVLEVPALGDFKVMDIQTDNGEDQLVSIKFSDPLLQGQDLQGLITFEDTSARELRFSINLNEIKVYPPQRLVGVHRIHINTGILNAMGYRLPAGTVQDVEFEDLKPGVAVLGQGVIIPNTEKLTLPFQATNLSAVDVVVTKIYENNVGQFLQVNQLNGTDELRRVGRIVARSTVKLDQHKLTDLRKPNRFYLDLSKIMKAEPGAIYNVKFSYKKKYSLYRCPGAVAVQPEEEELESLENEDWDEPRGYDYYGWEYEDYYWDDYNWNERDDPCTNSYYNPGRWVSRNIMVSDIGLVAKKGAAHEYFIAVTNIQTAQPMANVSLELHDYQRQVLAAGTSDQNGWVRLKTERKPFLLMAKSGRQKGYLRLDDGSSLSMSHFNVSGEVVQRGLKGFLYGERGVWRPGDNIYVTFILDDAENKLPQGHPVAFELYNPHGQLYRRIINNKPFHNFYTFSTSTESDAPTGNWLAKVKVGGAVFQKTLKIETIMPNRLKIKLDFGKPYLEKGEELNASVEARWLHGATAQHLKTTVDVSLTRLPTTFKKFEDYVFDDPARRFESENKQILDGELDENGTVKISTPLEAKGRAAGMLNASFLTKVFEPGGNFSIDQFDIPYYPYENFLGIKIPKGRDYGTLFTDTTHTIKIVNLNPDGSYVKGKKTVEVKFYKMDWRWWWDGTHDNLGRYAESSYHQALRTETVELIDGRGSWKMRVNYPEWGRYLVRITDPQTQHATGGIVYMDWPGWMGRSADRTPEEATMLSLSTDKKAYRVGEEVSLTIPSGKGGRALISLENGTRVVQAHWLQTQAGESRFSFKVTKEMLPNIFVHVTLLQPHGQTVNDLPIRLYGVEPLTIEDPSTILKPLIAAAHVIRPQEPTTIRVSESNGREMTYTLAIVDEGLLDLTRFKTPDPHPKFYAHEALGVKTWDLYDYVLGAYGMQLNRLLAIGGDEDANRKTGAAKANRFKPVVQFLGPFHLKAGATAAHEVTLPQYVGSVKVMVVAAHQGAYGFGEKAVPVRSPLMVLGTMPRTLSPGESLKFPVTVFAMEKHVRNVTVEIQPNAMLQAVGTTSKAISYKSAGEQMVAFDLKVRNQLGIAKVKVIARSGNERAEYDVELDVRNPNPYVTRVYEGTLQAGQTWTKTYTPVGIEGTNNVTLEVSSLPPMNLKNRLDYLIQYPHGCLEQITSSVFPQLVLNNMLELDQTKKRQIEKHVREALQRIKSYQHPSGGLAYWPGSPEVNEWGTTYAGHMMLEAQNLGYTLPLNLLEDWKQYQRRTANEWNYQASRSDLQQAYRLYTLALAKSPELGAMNRLKETKGLSAEAAWRLAAAYALAGQKETAVRLTQIRPPKPEPYRELGSTFGSDVRDEAMVLETMVLLGKKEESSQLVRKLATELNKAQWLSTQTTAYALLAISKYCGKTQLDQKLVFSCTLGNTAEKNFDVKAFVTQVNVPVKAPVASSVKMRNQGKHVQFVKLVLQGQPLTGDTTTEESNLRMTVSYTDLKGNAIDPLRLEQGTDFIAVVELKNPSNRFYEQMALTQVFPPGWEIVNTRIGSELNVTGGSVPTYQDIRDDRVLTYFDLPAAGGKTFKVLLNASYMGRFYLPSVYTEAMYDNTIRARTGGRWVEIVPRGGAGRVASR